MRILVYDVAAEDGGGLFVLKNFYREVLANDNRDIDWTFMVSTDEIVQTDKVRVLCYPQVKISWKARLRFEYLQLPKIVKELDPDLVISLQNMPIKRCKVRQFVYLHQSLQYCPKKFSLLKGEERGLAIRQKFISFLIKNAMPKAEHIFVQTQWIKDATVKWLRRDEKEITIVPVRVNTDGISIKEYTGAESRTFFYPARAEIYKNHSLIMEACKILKERGVSDYRVLLTMQRDENPYAERITASAESLPVAYIGAVSYEEIWDIYSRSILLFPSYLETCGLPMLEARRAGALILASDMPFSHEALDGYPNAAFFGINGPEKLAELMQKCLENPAYHKVAEKDDRKAESLLCSMMKLI